MLEAIEKACAGSAALVTVTHHPDEIPRGTGRVPWFEAGRMLG